VGLENEVQEGVTGNAETYGAGPQRLRMFLGPIRTPIQWPVEL